MSFRAYGGLVMTGESKARIDERVLPAGDVAGMAADQAERFEMADEIASTRSTAR